MTTTSGDTRTETSTELLPERRFLGRDDVNDIESILRDDETNFGDIS
ncbi:MAG: hypothetical protein JHC66_03645, partial [Acidimicrobiia bacterium]|nr:hypothetical protein [Acidimicrobiia bacterium]